MRSRLTRAALAEKKIATGSLLLQQEYLDESEAVESPGERQVLGAQTAVRRASTTTPWWRRIVLSTYRGRLRVTRGKASPPTSSGKPVNAASTSGWASLFPTTPCSCVSGFGSFTSRSLRIRRCTDLTSRQSSPLVAPSEPARRTELLRFSSFSWTVGPLGIMHLRCRSAGGTHAATEGQCLGHRAAPLPWTAGAPECPRLRENTTRCPVPLLDTIGATYAAARPPTRG